MKLKSYLKDWKLISSTRYFLVISIRLQPPLYMYILYDVIYIYLFYFSLIWKSHLTDQRRRHFDILTYVNIYVYVCICMYSITLRSPASILFSKILFLISSS